MLVLGACSSIVEGTYQEIMVTTDPPGATCDLTKEGTPVAVITTPKMITVKRTKHDIDIHCEMDGYHDAQFVNNSGIQSTTAGNVAFAIGTLGIGAIVGWGVDSATGADNEYDSSVLMLMTPLSEPAPEVQDLNQPEPEKKDETPDFPE